ncbi:universal stress protein [Streptomyces sp. A7024]|uniref:Universal stress protein n=1 Tax=Streptomyces coryli TaxID=1128680 RepID=A0A6G4TR50_9ACTN|nr:universal stress protein [Streptomyces coryli]NGN62489.1 universal stress protein [Streptomyces coryli]
MVNSPDVPPLHGRVVLGYDGSGSAELALEYAVDEAVRRGAGLEILCGDPWPSPAPPGEGLTAEDHRSRYRATRDLVEHAAEKAGKLAPGLIVVPSVTAEDAVQALLRCGRSASLTVVGTRGHGGFAGLLLGSVSLRLAARADGPVLVVRGDGEPRERSQGTVLVGVQAGSEEPALRHAFEDARRRKARLHALHAWRYPPMATALTRMEAERIRDADVSARRTGESLARYAVAPLREEFRDVPVTAGHECGSASAALVEASRTADLLVLTARRNPRRLGAHLGPVTHAALQHAHCPVLLVPAP